MYRDDSPPRHGRYRTLTGPHLRDAHPLDSIGPFLRGPYPQGSISPPFGGGGISPHGAVRRDLTPPPPQQTSPRTMSAHHLPPPPHRPLGPARHTEAQREGTPLPAPGRTAPFTPPRGGCWWRGVGGVGETTHSQLHHILYHRRHLASAAGALRRPARMRGGWRGEGGRGGRRESGRSAPA